MNLNKRKLTAELKKQGITQKRLAESIGVSRQTVCTIFGGASCKEETALKIADALGVPLERLEVRG